MTQGVSFHYCLWWFQALEEDKTRLMQLFCSHRNNLHCNPSKIVCLSVARVVKREQGSSKNYSQFRPSLSATGTVLESGQVGGRVLASLCLLINIPQSCR